MLKIFDNIIEKYEALISYEPGEISVEGARFRLDFGPWKAGQRVEYIHFDYEQGFVIEGNRKHEELRRVAIELRIAEVL